MNALLVVGVTSAALFAVALSFVVGYRRGFLKGWTHADGITLRILRGAESER